MRNIKMNEQKIKQEVMNKLKGFSPTIIQEKISKDKTDSFFYEGDIAEIEKPNGTLLTLIATGDIKIVINKSKEEDEFYYNGNLWEAINHYNLTDDKLREMEESGDLEFINNNWFEVVWLKKGNEYTDSDMGVVVGDYDEAIELLKSYYEDDEY